VRKPKLEWAEKGEAEDFDAAAKFLSLQCSDAKAKALIREGPAPGLDNEHVVPRGARQC